jgi:hypothetical protein
MMKMIDRDASSTFMENVLTDGMALAPSQYVDRLDIYHAHVMTPAL